MVGCTYIIQAGATSTAKDSIVETEIAAIKVALKNFRIKLLHPSELFIDCSAILALLGQEDSICSWRMRKEIDQVEV